MLLADLTVLGVVAAAEVLDVGPIARWALVRTFAEVSSLFRLVTRALPMLLLFMTFLFINTEVWQVSSALSRPVLWLAVAFFGVLALGFLLARLPEEVAAVNDDLDPEVVQRAVRGTPLEPHLDDLTTCTPSRWTVVSAPTCCSSCSSRRPRRCCCWRWRCGLFFLAFGRVAIDDSVVHSWVGDGAPHYPRLLGDLGFSRELLQVSIFLSAFSGLYFTVYAVTDSTYREQFFHEITARAGAGGRRAGRLPRAAPRRRLSRGQAAYVGSRAWSTAPSAAAAPSCRPSLSAP